MMKIQNRQFDKNRGSALILVVVVTVLLAVIGVMFLMVSRVSEMETVTIADSRDLNGAVETVVNRIHEVLLEDLFGADGILVNGDGSDEPYDIADAEDPWLASLEPYNNAGIYQWPRVTDLWGTIETGPDSLYARTIMDNDIAARVSVRDIPVAIISPSDSTELDPAIPYGARADADGDGVADSRWVKIPGLTSSRGKDIFAAIRIIDNGAMLNLNTAMLLYQEPYDGTSPFFEDTSGKAVSFYEKPWFSDQFEYDNFVLDFNGPGFDTAKQHLYHRNHSTGSGHYLTEMNYLPFLRGSDLTTSTWYKDSSGDDWDNLMKARGFWNSTTGDLYTPQQCQAILMKIEDPGDAYQFFGIGDELEIRNRYLLTSRVEARFAQKAVANFSLDSGGGAYAALEVPIDTGSYTYGSGTLPNFNKWKVRVNSANFDKWSGAFVGTINGEQTDYSYRYDRRHVCTFYSFDRDFRTGDYPLLDSDLAVLTAGWTLENKEKAEKVFRPEGKVTADFYAMEQVGTLWTANNTETRRRILHLLYAFREYFYDRNGGDLTAAAKSAAQVVANMIDYADENEDYSASFNHQGPFYNAQYGTQANVDCTFITEDIIQNMIDEVSEGLIPTGIMDLGLPAGEVIFGYERQPFFSEIYADWDEGADSAVETDDQLLGFGIEVINPYFDQLDMEGWKLVIGKGASAREFIFPNNPAWYVPGHSVDGTLGRWVYRSSNAVPVSVFAGIIPVDIPGLIDIRQLYYEPGGSVEIKLMRPAPANPAGVAYICVDSISDTIVRSILNRTPEGRWICQRDDDHWKFVFNEFTPAHQPGMMYQGMGFYNQTNTSRTDVLQVGVADDGRPGNRWHDLEVLSLFGNVDETDPNSATLTVTSKLANATLLHFDVTSALNSPSAYIAPVARPDYGSVPGRININTAPAVVMAAAIPPTLADPNAATSDPVGFSALDAAQAIAANRPYQTLDDLLTVDWVKQYASGGAREDENVGCQSIRGDIEEEHWVLSNLANKFTVRSDVFTAYILVRLGTDGPQRRMLAIFDRSNVWDENDRPELVALHPVPDPR